MIMEGGERRKKRQSKKKKQQMKLFDIRAIPVWDTHSLHLMIEFSMLYFVSSSTD